MPAPSDSRSSIYASRLFSRSPLDLRARLLATHSTGESIVVHARTFDLSCTGAGLMLTRELPSGTEVTLSLRLPTDELSLKAIITRRDGFRAGLRFIQPTAQQRLLLSELCYA